MNPLDAEPLTIEEVALIRAARLADAYGGSVPWLNRAVLAFAASMLVDSRRRNTE